LDYRNKYRIEPNRWQYWDYSAQGEYFITLCISNREAILGKIIDGEMHLSEYGEIVKNELIKMGSYNQRATMDEWVIMPNHVHCIITLGPMYDCDAEKIDDCDPEKIDDCDAEKIDRGDVEKIHEFSLHPPAQLLPISSQPPAQLLPISSQPPAQILPISSQPPAQLLPKSSQPPAQFLPKSSSQHPVNMDIKQYRRIRRKMLIPLMEGKFKMLTSKQINLLRKTTGQVTWQHDYYDHVIRDNYEYDRIKQYIINNPAKWQDDTFNNENGGMCKDDGDGLWY
jgi:REP element-mobilizing transposase RayT